jgi:peroxiredoxin
LREHPDLNVVFVAMASPDEAAEFRARVGSPHRFVADPDRKLHGLFGIESAGFAQVLNPRVLLRGVSAMRYGVSQPTGDPRSLGGAFVVSRAGEVVWSRRARDVADNASPEEIAAALAAAE